MPEVIKWMKEIDISELSLTGGQRSVPENTPTDNNRRQIAETVR